jgi:glycerol-3-phosphate acyltransferase PlsY
VLVVVLVAAAYVLGSMPWGYWLVRLFRGEDVRTVGSGNIGGTNVWRVYGPSLGAPVVFLDTAKGFAPALVATLLVGHWAGVLAGAAAMAGHWRPLFLGWKRGGKMVATCGGAFLGVAPIVGGLGAGVWLLAFALTRYASVASMSAAVSLPLWSWLMGYPWPVIAFGAVAAAAVIVLHRANIQRLLHGQENRVSLRRRRADRAPTGTAPAGRPPAGSRPRPSRS